MTRRDMDIRPRKRGSRAAMLAIADDVIAMVEAGEVVAIGAIVLRRDGSILRKCEAVPEEPFAGALVEKLIGTKAGEP